MTTLKDYAKAYDPQGMKNIVDLEAVSVEQEIKEVVKKNKDNEEYKVSVVVIEGEEYRVPNSVVEQLQTILVEKPDMKTFKVTKKGENMNTSYTVIQLE